MKYVKIKSKTYNDALMELRMKYGEDAIPISHKYVKEGGMFNSRLFARDMVELTAAIHTKRTVKAAPMEKKSTIDVRADSDVSKNIYASPADMLQKNKPFVPAKSEAYAARIGGENRQMNKNSSPYAGSTEGDDMVQLSQEEYGSLKKFEKEFYEIRQTLNKLLESQSSGSGKAIQTVSDEDDRLEPFRTILRNNDFTEDECSKLIKEVRNSMSKDDLKDKYKIEKTLKDLLKSKVVTAGGIEITDRKKILMFVGPTGVGKTTSLAKLGAIYSLRENKKVAFVTIDTYRIAATEQLKKYADIMKIPVHVVNTQKEFKTVIDNETSDVILVDTSGRSHKNSLKISEIKSFAEQIDFDFEKILCVSATTKKDDVRNIFKSFDKMQFNSVMITKVDETSFVGNVVDVAKQYNKPISYIANGQEVPNDIAVAEVDKLVDMMVVGNIQN